MVENGLILGVLLVVAAILVFHPRLQASRAWKAMLTPTEKL